MAPPQTFSLGSSSPLRAACNVACQNSRVDEKMVTFPKVHESGDNVEKKMGEHALMQRDTLEAVSFFFPLNEMGDVQDVLEFVEREVWNVEGNEMSTFPDGKPGLVVYCKVKAKNVGAVYADHVLAKFKRERGGPVGGPSSAGAGSSRSATGTTGAPCLFLVVEDGSGERAPSARRHGCAERGKERAR